MALFVQVRHLLAGDVEWDPRVPLGHVAEEAEVEEVNRRTARPKRELALLVALLGQRFGHVGVFDDGAAAVGEDEVAQLVFRTKLGHDLGGDLGLGLQVVPEEGRVADFHQRVVHLEIEDVPDPPPP